MVSMQHERLPETHVVGIIGAHGVGKSDLIYRVRHSIPAQRKDKLTRPISWSPSLSARGTTLQWRLAIGNISW